MNAKIKEGLWWVLGIILMVVLINLVFALEGPVAAQTAIRPPDMVSRSLDKTIVVQPDGRRVVVPAPHGAGTRVVTPTVRKVPPRYSQRAQRGATIPRQHARPAPRWVR